MKIVTFFFVFGFVACPIYFTFFKEPPFIIAGVSAGFLSFTLILVVCTVCLSFLYNLLLMILGVFFGLIISGFAGILFGIFSALERFQRDVTWARYFFENSYNHESILWNSFLIIGVFFNLLTIYLFDFLVRDRKPK